MDLIIKKCRLPISNYSNIVVDSNIVLNKTKNLFQYSLQMIVKRQTIQLIGVSGCKKISSILHAIHIIH